MKHLLLLLIKFYQFFISPWLGKNCCYFPTCSEYAKDSINNFGIIKGLSLSFIRLIKCNPWSSGGFDPVRNKVIPFSILNQTNEFQGEAAQRSDLRAHNQDLQNSFVSFKMENGINHNK